MGKSAQKNGSILQAHHGSVVAGKDLYDAVYTSEELEETARIYLLLKSHNYNTLDPDQVQALLERFGQERGKAPLKRGSLVSIFFQASHSYLTEI